MAQYVYIWRLAIDHLNPSEAICRPETKRERFCGSVLNLRFASD
jgi:hypothetical protein